jgi:hypothetical protein
MKKIIGRLGLFALSLFICWLLGGIVLSLAVHHCWMIHTVAASLGVAEGSFVNYANASLVLALLGYTSMSVSKSNE